MIRAKVKLDIIVTVEDVLLYCNLAPFPLFSIDLEIVLESMLMLSLTARPSLSQLLALSRPDDQ